MGFLLVYKYQHAPIQVVLRLSMQFLDIGGCAFSIKCLLHKLDLLGVGEHFAARAKKWVNRSNLPLGSLEVIICGEY